VAYKVQFPDITSTLHLHGFHFRVSEAGWSYPEDYHNTSRMREMNGTGEWGNLFDEST